MTNKYPDYKTKGWDLAVGKFTVTNHGNGNISIDNRETLETATFDRNHIEDLITRLFASSHRRKLYE